MPQEDVLETLAILSDEELMKLRKNKGITAKGRPQGIPKRDWFELYLASPLNSSSESSQLYSPYLNFIN